MFTYRRPNEISSTAGESFLAEGPTNEVLDVYVSEIHRLIDVHSLTSFNNIDSVLQIFIHLSGQLTIPT